MEGTNSHAVKHWYGLGLVIERLYQYVLEILFCKQWLDLGGRLTVLVFNCTCTLKEPQI